MPLESSKWLLDAKGRRIIRLNRILSWIVRVLSGFWSHVCYLYLYLVTGFQILDNYGKKKINKQE